MFSQSHNTQQTFTQDFSTVPGVTIPLAPSESGTHGPPVTNINNWRIPSASIPIHLYYPQGRYPTLESDSYGYLRDRDPNFGTRGFVTPPYTYKHPIPQLNGPKSSERVAGTFITGPGGQVLTENNQFYLRPIYQPPPGLVYSHTPAFHPVTNQLRAPTQDIAATFKTTTHPLVPNLPFPLPGPQVSEALSNIRVPTSQPAGQNRLVVQKPEQVITASPSDENTSSSEIHAIIKECKLSSDVPESFWNIVPLLSRISAKKVSGVLISILRSSQKEVALEEFYNLLYNEASALNYISDTQVPNSEEHGPTPMKSEEHALLHLIFSAYRTPHGKMGPIPGILMRNPRLPASKFHELSREFWAIKIIFATVKKVKNAYLGTTSISGITVYKIYYLICQKLIKKYPSISAHVGFQKRVIVGHSHLSRLTKMVYPNIRKKRLGQRGQSRAHYIGLTLNDSMIDPETQQLLQLDISQLKRHFNQDLSENFEHRRKNFVVEAPCVIGGVAVDPRHALSYNAPFLHVPVPSYVQSGAVNPEYNVAPPHWDYNTGRLSEQSMGAVLLRKKPLRP